MKIGFYSSWDIDKTKFVGDHLYAGYLCKNLLKLKGVESADVYAPNKLPSEKLDFLIYLNASPPKRDLAKKHIIYLQNAYSMKAAKEKLNELKPFNFDLYIFCSKELKELSKKMGNKSELLTFSAEMSVFYPRESNKKYEFDISYVGNDIKGKEKTTKYILPAANFKFGLFGNWNYSKKDMLKYLYFFMPRYKKILKQKSKGKISQENISLLYTNSKININCTSQDFIDCNASTGRPFEITACKGFLITDDIPCLREILGDGAVYTSGGKDLKEKIEYYLEHEDERKSIAEKGYNKVVNHENVFKKAEVLVKYLKEIK